MRQRRIRESMLNRRTEAGIELSRLTALIGITSLFAAGCSAGAPGPPSPTNDGAPFHLIEASISGIHDAYRSKRLTTRGLVELYLARIDAYDKKGPNINAVITISPKALEDADRLDKAFAASGFVGPLHGIPILLKDQMDAEGMPTTLGSVLFKDYQPRSDAFVTKKLKDAGAIILGKTTLGELGGGDTHGSLFGSTRNPYALDRTAGGSSGGSGAAVAANLTAVGDRPGRERVHPPALGMERHRRHAADARAGQPNRRL